VPDDSVERKYLHVRGIVEAELAGNAEHEAIFPAERDASRTDADDSAVTAEEHDWQAVVGDGVT